MRPARTRCTHDSAADPIRLLLVGVTWSAYAQPGLDYRRNRRVLPKEAPQGEWLESARIPSRRRFSNLCEGHLL